ncbi:MAG: hypothetical protein JWM34_906 [Ilumatobacteraceae bacterium]|nr:hypothetical protein [Ilumatobacteraceae bacterium]
MRHPTPLLKRGKWDDEWTSDEWDDPTVTEAAVVEKSPRRQKALKWLVFTVGSLAVVGLLSAGAVGWWYIRQVNPSGEAEQSVNFTVNATDTLDSVSTRLQEIGVITNARVFRYYVTSKGGITFTPGYYELKPRDHMGNLMRVLNTPPAATYKRITFPEGFTLAQMANRVQRDLPPMTSGAFLTAAQSPELHSTLAPAGTTSLEGLLFPDTYQVAGNESEAQVIQRMINLMERVGRQEDIDAGAAELGHTPYEVLIVASMVEREAKFDDDRAKIARVIYNRLDAGMPLQIDATLLYGQPAGTKFADVRYVDTPYNTYMHNGLPPTPIANPGRASIEAALHPAAPLSVGDPLCRDVPAGTKCQLLYYVLADADGHHVFAVTEAQHEINVQKARDAGLLGP